jgi:nucleotide-binding universal stress UspA family protein
MNEILVGFDFSESAKNALDHAVSMAEKFKSHLLLVWVEDKDSIRQLGLKNEADIPQHIQTRFQELIAGYVHQIPASRIEIEIRKGIVYKEIVAAAHEKQVDLIVVGAHGVSGLRRFFMGDNANHIIAEAKCPVLSIRENRDSTRELKTIVVPIDSSLDTRQKVPLAARFAYLFDAEIHILGIYFSEVGILRKRVNSYVEQTEAFFEKSGIQKITISYTKSDNGARTIMNYANKVNAGLIVTMIETESQSMDWWLGSQGQQMVNQATAPILSITNKEIMRSRPGM